MKAIGAMVLKKDQVLKLLIQENPLFQVKENMMENGKIMICMGKVNNIYCVQENISMKMEMYMMENG